MMIPVTTRRLDAALLPAFLPYLNPLASEGLREGWEEILAVGAVADGGKTGGAAAVALDGGVLTLFSLYVVPAVRGQGIGTRLLDALWACCPEARPAASWIQPVEDFDRMDAFLQARGFAPARRDRGVYCLHTTDLRRVPVVRRAFSPTFQPDGNIVPLAQLTPGEREDLGTDPGIDPRLRLDSLMDQAAPQLSFGYRYRGRIAAYLLCAVSDPGEVSILAAVARPGAHPAAFLQLVTAAIHQGLALFGDDFVCWLDPITQQAEALARELSGGTCQRWLTGESDWAGGPSGVGSTIPPEQQNQ